MATSPTALPAPARGTPWPVWEVPVCASRSLPLGSVAAPRPPRARRSSLEEVAPHRNQHAAQLQLQQQPLSTRQRVRRFSIAIGEKLHVPLGTIQEHLQDDTAPTPDQDPTTLGEGGLLEVPSAAASSNSSSRATAASGQPGSAYFPQGVSFSAGTNTQQQLQQQHARCCAGPACMCNPALLHVQQHQQQQQGSNSSSAPLPQFTARHPAAHTRHQQSLWQQQQYQDLHQQQQHLLQEAAHNAAGWSQEQVWQFLQQRRMQQQQSEQQQQQLRQAREPRWRRQQQQHQDEQQQQQPLLAWHDDSWQLLELSSSRPTTSRHHASAEQQLHQLHQQQQQRAREQRQALSALQVIEHELQQLLAMQEWLAQAYSTAVPGSRASVACASALLQHQQVLRQAVDAREALGAAALEATAALAASGRLPSIAAGSAGMHRGHDTAPTAAGPPTFELDSSHYNCLEGEPLYPADADVLLQHFGHFAII